MRKQTASLTRVWVILSVKIGLLLLLVGRLIQLTVFHNPHYSTLAYGNRIHCRMLPAQRGRILDEQGQVLADAQQTFNGYVLAETPDDLKTRLDDIEKIIGKSVHVQGAFARKCVLPLKESLSWEDMAKLETRKIPGVFVASSSMRTYPVHNVFSHVLGFVSPPTVKDDSALQYPFLTVGHGGGVEQIYDEKLRGTTGYIEEEMDARRRLIRILDTTPPEIGSDISTTINKDLQEFTYQTLQEHNINSAGVVVLDAQTGAVKTLVSYPAYDNNLFSKGIPSGVWKNLTSNPYRPLFNKVIQGQYAPGSVFKIVMALAGLRSGVITENTTAFCPGYMESGGRRVHCWAWRKGGHGHVNFNQAVAGSCDVFFYQMAKKILIQDVVDVAQALGLGQKTGIDLLCEQKGLLPQTTWFKRKNLGEMLNLSIGQGRLLTTPLQLAVMMAAIVNGGQIIRPHILSKSSEGIVKTCSGLQGKDMEILKKALVLVANSPEGTAHNFQFFTKDGKYGFSGKTGTTQVSGISKKERETDQINNKSEFLRDHALFVGFAPAENPKHVIAIVLEHGGWGANACRIGQKILKRMG